MSLLRVVYVNMEAELVSPDQQLGQLYELMQAIQKQGHDGDDG